MNDFGDDNDDVQSLKSLKGGVAADNTNKLSKNNSTSNQQQKSQTISNLIMPLSIDELLPAGAAAVSSTIAPSSTNNSGNVKTTAY